MDNKLISSYTFLNVSKIKLFTQFFYEGKSDILLKFSHISFFASKYSAPNVHVTKPSRHIAGDRLRLILTLIAILLLFTDSPVFTRQHFVV